MTIDCIIFKAAGQCGAGVVLVGCKIFEKIIAGDKKDGSTWVRGGSQSVDEDQGEAKESMSRAFSISSMSTTDELPAELICQETPCDLEGNTFQCPHCCKKFETEEALQGHDICFDHPTKVDDAAKSGNGKIAAAGVKLDGTVQCAECNQKFDSQEPLSPLPVLSTWRLNVTAARERRDQRKRCAAMLQSKDGIVSASQIHSQ